MHEVARTMLDKFVLQGSPHEVNIPHTMRTRTEERFAHQITTVVDFQHHLSVAGHEGLDEYLKSKSDNNYVKNNENDNQYRGEGNSAPTGDTDINPGRVLSSSGIYPFSEFLRFFEDAQKEIYELTRKDSYARWKNTQVLRAR